MLIGPGESCNQYDFADQMDGEKVIISYQREFIFLKTQKTAGTSVELALSALCGPNDVLTPLSPEEEQLRLGSTAPNVVVPTNYRPWWSRITELTRIVQARGASKYVSHMPAKVVRARMDPDHFDRFRKVTIVRNPWDREVSLYFWHVRNMASPPAFSDFVRRRRQNAERKTFKIYSIDGAIVATDVLRYESLEEDYANFVRSLGVDDVPPLPRAKSTHRPSYARNYQAMYDSISRERVAKLYTREIDAFQYSF